MSPVNDGGPRERMDYLNVICPYCGDAYQAEHEDFSDAEREEECFMCKRVYLVHQEFEVTHHTRPIPVNRAQPPTHPTGHTEQV